MILEHEQWCFGYDQILKDCRPNSTETHAGTVARTVLLLCSADVDAMASARILSYMLRSDGIRYVLLPCFGYRDFESKLEGMVSGGSMDDIGAMVLLNFGASRNLHKLYQHHHLLGENGIKIYVMDCRRPVHLANVYSPSGVVVFLDSTQNLKDMPSDGDNLSGDDSTSDESSSSSSSSSDSDGDSDDEGGNARGHGSDGDRDENAEEEANFDDVVGEAVAVAEQSPEKATVQTDPNYDAEDESDGDGSDNDDAKEDGSSDRAAKRRKTDTDTDPGGTDQTGENDETPQTEPGPGPRVPVVSPRELHARRRNRVRKYYSDGGFYGSPSSFVAYALASGNRYGEDGDLLWLACVGVTDAYLHARLDLIGYAKLAGQLTDRCRKLYPNDAFERALTTVYAEDLDAPSSGGGGGNRRRGAMRTKTRIALSENGRIVSEKDFRFFLLKHCSLLDSMQYSDYVCTRMKLYTKKGEQQLLELLAKMGYPLDECQQPFPFMRPSLRRRLKDKLGMHAQDYNLDRFEFTSFSRVTGYSSLLSASDTSYAVTALLEHDTAQRSTNHNSPGGHTDRGNNTVAGIEAFHHAYDAMGSHSLSEPIGGVWNSNHNNSNTEGTNSSNLVNGGNLSSTVGIGAGLRRAMVLQKAIVHTAVGLVERNAIALLRHFRYVHVTSSSSSSMSSSSSGGGHIIRTNDLIRSNGNDDHESDPDNHDQHLFSKPLALNRLAHFLMDMHRENGKWTGLKARPLVMIADQPKKQANSRNPTCLIVGYEYPERSGDFLKNSFGKHFEMTAKSMNGNFRFDSFDSNVVEVDANDVQRFMEQLHYLLDSM